MLLLIIFLLFIGNGLPNSLLGSAWTAICAATGAPMDAAGTISMVMMAGPILTCLFVGQLLKRFRTEQIALFGGLLAAASLVGFGLAKSAVWLYAMALPLGFGVGLLDSAVNLYVARRFGAKQINWLNCSWGVGAMLGPVIMSGALAAGSWRGGYFRVALILLAILGVLLFSFPLWRRAAAAEKTVEGETPAAGKPLSEFVRQPMFPVVIICVMLYFGVELGFGLWGGSYLTVSRGVDPARAALLVSVFYGAMTVGRFLSGFLTAVIQNKNMIRIGMCGMLAGLLLLFLPGDGTLGFAVYGLGCAPVFPCTLHEMKVRFGETDAAAHLGMLLGISRLGLAIFPELIGKISTATNFYVFLPLLIGLCGVMFALSETANRMVSRQKAATESRKEEAHA
ncbi:MAG TPA: MFS transporter [Candidatus Acidoferrum sp.]|nr:MFS transporter [Candidatus Acidoferrum sp.]